MLSYIKNLYNDGDNDGDVMIRCLNDRIILCHSFVISFASNTLKNQILSKTSLDKSNILELKLNYDVKLVNILFGYVYKESISNTKLTVDEILSLYLMQRI
jgi:hypothetical protein